MVIGHRQFAIASAQPQRNACDNIHALCLRCKIVDKEIETTDRSGAAVSRGRQRVDRRLQADRRRAAAGQRRPHRHFGAQGNAVIDVDAEEIDRQVYLAEIQQRAQRKADRLFRLQRLRLSRAGNRRGQRNGQRIGGRQGAGFEHAAGGYNGRGAHGVGLPWRRRAKARAQRAAQREVIRYRHTRGYFEVSGAPEIVEIFVAQGPAQCPPIVNIGL